MFDDLDDDDFKYDDTVGWATAAAADDGTQPDEWDAELAPVAVDVRSERQTTPIDPLLVRVGAVAVIGALLVPLLLNAGGGGTEELIGRAASAEAPSSTVTLLRPANCCCTDRCHIDTARPQRSPPGYPGRNVSGECDDSDTNVGGGDRCFAYFDNASIDRSIFARSHRRSKRNARHCCSR